MVFLFNMKSIIRERLHDQYLDICYKLRDDVRTPNYILDTKFSILKPNLSAEYSNTSL